MTLIQRHFAHDAGHLRYSEGVHGISARPVLRSDMTTSAALELSVTAIAESVYSGQFSVQVRGAPETTFIRAPDSSIRIIHDCSRGKAVPQRCHGVPSATCSFHKTPRRRVSLAVPTHVPSFNRKHSMIVIFTHWEALYWKGSTSNIRAGVHNARALDAQPLGGSSVRSSASARIRALLLLYSPDQWHCSGMRAILQC